jgi:hypothetical protein
VLGKAWELLQDFLKEKPYWPALQPFVLFGFFCVGAQSLAYQYIQTEYRFTPSWGMFLRSYVSIRITLVFAAIALGILLFKLGTRQSRAPAATGRLRTFLRAQGRRVLIGTAVVVIVTIGLIAAFRRYTPNRVSHIRVKFLGAPEVFDREALAYLVYELNRLQNDWYFVVDFETFNSASLTSAEEAACTRSSRPMLCYAEAAASGQPLIGITDESLGGAYFAEHRGVVSVISTHDRQAFEPLTTYEYLTYNLVVQGILIHLDAHGGGLPAGSFEPATTSHGGVFEFTPRREAIKATILAARLSPSEEELLFNRFGAAYLTSCKEMLSLDWLRSERVARNLLETFSISLSRQP